MRSAVFGRYWSTGGGAEKYGGVIAQLLAREGPVDLLSFDQVDLTWLAERLSLDLDGVSVRTIEDVPGAVTKASAEYDRFVNVTYMSTDPAAHRNSIYVVHFPSHPGAHVHGWKRGVLRATRTLRRSLPAEVHWGEGFFDREPGVRGVTWTTGHGRLFITTEPGTPVPISIHLADRRPPSVAAVDAEVVVDGRLVQTVRLDGSQGPVRRFTGIPVSFEVTSPAPDVAVEVEIRSDTFRPADHEGSGDARTLGVAVQSLQIGDGLLAIAAARFPLLTTRPMSPDWLDTYGLVVANSEFTRHWVQQLWRLTPEILHPPVTMFEPGAKEPMILNAGRFFPADLGHSKKQLEMVRAFRRLCDGGVRGWTLHLVGGCDDAGRSYLDAVRRAGEGYPVEVTVNATGEQLADLYSRASFYWHASGLGESGQRRPDRLEHFGITTVEAMSAGAVPIVIGLAGQIETVRDGVDGFHFASVRDLVARTRELIDDPARLARMSASARERARAYSVEAFDRRLQELMADMGAP